MSMMKRHFENEIERIAKFSGYSYGFLIDVFNDYAEDCMGDNTPIDMAYFERVSIERDW